MGDAPSDATGPGDAPMPMISPPDLGILVDEGYVSDDSVGEDGSEQGDVVNGLFAELRTKCRKCCCKKATSSRI